MNSEGCRLIGPADSQRRAPLTSRPMPGTSTSTSSVTAPRNSAGAARRHSRTGTCTANTPDTTAKARNTACRARKYVGLPPVNALASASAIDAEYTMTSPKPSRSTAAHNRTASYSGACARMALMRAATGQPRHRRAKHLAAVRVVAEHVEACARRRQQHGVARLRLLGGAGHRFRHAGRAHHGQLETGERLLDQRRIAADQHHGPPGSGERL